MLAVAWHRGVPVSESEAPVILRERALRQRPAVFRAMTGLTVAEFDALLVEALPRYAAAERARLGRPGRRRAIGAGRKYTLPHRDHLLLAIVWLRRYPTNVVLGYLFGVSEYVALRTVQRVVPWGVATFAVRPPAPRLVRVPVVAAPAAACPASPTAGPARDSSRSRGRGRAAARTRTN